MLAVVVGLTGVVGGLGALLARDAVRARDDLAVVRTEVLEAQQRLAEGNVEAAEAELAAARVALGPASRSTNRLLWDVAARVPFAGRTVTIVRDTVALADAGLEFGRQVLDATRDLVVDGAPALEAEAGRLSLTPLRDAARRVEDVDARRLADLVDQVTAHRTALVPIEVRAGRQESLLLARDLLESFERTRGVVSVLPAFLGDEAPRRYFLAMQNPAELRGTGGFLGYFATVTVDQGRFVLGQPQVYSAIEDPSDGPVGLPQGTARGASPEFEARYAPARASTFLANVNVDPDVPTTSEVLLDLYQDATGERLDGVIMVDPIALGRVLEVVGPVRLPDDVVPGDPRLPNPIRGRDVATAILVDEYEVFGGFEPDRKVWLESLATTAFEQLFSSQWDAVAMARTLAVLGGEGHVQLYSRDDREQGAFAPLRLSGRVRQVQGQDLIAVTANNVAANKADAHVGHLHRATVRLSERTGETFLRTSDLEVSVDNPLPTSGMDAYIIGSSPQDGQRAQGPTGPRGLTRTWFSVWMPPTARILEVRDGHGRPQRSGVYEIHDTRVVDHVLEVPSESVGTFGVTWSGDAHVVREGDDLVYRLVWHRQAKAIPDRLDLTIEVPFGFHVVAADVEGGGHGAGLGPYGDPGPVVALAAEGPRNVEVRGDLTSDVEVVIRFRAD